MVVFTCNQCGDSLKKNKVEPHLRQCRTRSLSCVDCLTDFDTQSYNKHYECISEDQKYGGQNYQQPEFKGKAKQTDWVQKIKSLISENQYPREIQNILNSLVHYENIPRKKPKFSNFVKNSFRIRDDNLISKIWDIFQNSLKTNADPKPIQATQNQASSDQSIQSSNNQKNGFKRSISEALEENDKVDENINPEKKIMKMVDDPQMEEGTAEKLKMKKVIKSFLSDNSKMSISKLRKKVTKIYHKNGFTDDEEIERKFNNITRKSSFVINESYISLAQ